MNRRHSLVALASLLTACGGGGGGAGAPFPSFSISEQSPSEQTIQKPIVLHFGDSFTTGASMPARLSELHRLPMFTHVDRAHGGMSSIDLWTGRAPSPHAPFRQHLQVDPSAAVVFRFGGVEALNDEPVDTFYYYMRELCIAATEANRNIILIGAVDLPETEMITPKMLKRYWENNEVMRTSGLPFVDLSHIKVLPHEMFDPLHPNVAAIERMADSIAAQVLAKL